MRIEKLRAAYGVQVEWIHFPLHPDTPAEGRTLQDMFAGRGMDIPAMKARMVGLMAEEGLPYGDRDMTYNSRLAQELGKWAETQPGGGAIHDAMFKAYFVDTVNLFNVDALVSIAESVGLPSDEARQVLKDRSFSDAVDADWRRAAQDGITGVPTFVAGGYGLVGAQPYDVLESLVVKARGEPRAPAV